MNVPNHLMHVTGLTDEGEDPISGVQFAVLDPNGERHAYGDQSWVAYGRCVTDGSHPAGRIQRRSVTVTYGEWVDHDD